MAYGQTDANDAGASSSSADLDGTDILAGGQHVQGSESGGDSSTPGNEGANPGNEPAKDVDPLDILRGVEGGKDPFKADEKPGADSPDGTGSEKAPGEADKAKGEGGEPSDDYTDVGFHKHPRFQQLLRERDGYRTDASTYRDTMATLARHGVTAEEAQNALQISAFLRTDPFQAWELLRPIVVSTMQAVGQIVPEDLQQRVARGEITWEVAQEFSVERARAEAGKRAAQVGELVRQHDAQAALVADIRDTGARWAQRQREKGVITDANESAFQKELNWVLHEDGHPRNRQEALARLDKALTGLQASAPRQVTQQSGNGAQPAQAARRPEQRPMGGGSSANGAKPEPQSIMDIVRAGGAAA